MLIYRIYSYYDTLICLHYVGLKLLYMNSLKLLYMMADDS